MPRHPFLLPANRLCPPLSGFISGKGRGLTENQGMHTGRDNAKVGAVGRRSRERRRSPVMLAWKPLCHGAAGCRMGERDLSSEAAELKQRSEEVKRRRDEETKRRRDEEAKRRRDEETKRRRDEETKRRRDEETKRRRDEETKRRRDEETKRRRDEYQATRVVSHTRSGHIKKQPRPKSRLSVWCAREDSNL